MCGCGWGWGVLEGRIKIQTLLYVKLIITPSMHGKEVRMNMSTIDSTEGTSFLSQLRNWIHAADHS